MLCRVGSDIEETAFWAARRSHGQLGSAVGVLRTPPVPSARLFASETHVHMPSNAHRDTQSITRLRAFCGSGQQSCNIDPFRTTVQCELAVNTLQLVALHTDDTLHYPTPVSQVRPDAPFSHLRTLTVHALALASHTCPQGAHFVSTSYARTLPQRVLATRSLSDTVESSSVAGRVAHMAARQSIANQMRSSNICHRLS